MLNIPEEHGPEKARGADARHCSKARVGCTRHPGAYEHQQPRCKRGAEEAVAKDAPIGAAEESVIQRPPHWVAVSGGPRAPGVGLCRGACKAERARDARLKKGHELAGSECLRGQSDRWRSGRSGKSAESS